MLKVRNFLPLLALGLVSVSWAQSAPATAQKVTAEQKTEVLAKVNQIMSETAFVPGIDFKKWPSYLEAQKKDIDSSDTPIEFVTAINKALTNFGASHIVMSTPQMAENRRQKRGVGLGVQIQPEAGKGIRIVGVFPKSAADEAGLRVGDLVVKANGKKVEGPTDLQGEEGQTVTLAIVRDGKNETIKVTRRAYSNVRPEELKWVNNDTAMLKVWTFDQGYNRENVEKLMGEAAKSKNLILDLRSNPGGAVLNLMHLLGLVMADGSNAGAFLARRDVDKYVKDTGGSPTDFEKIAKQSSTILRARKGRGSMEPYAGNVIVLVNGGSGSAAEIAAAALSEVRDAPVIGTQSAGAVLASIIGPLPHGYALQYPIMDYVSPKGLRLEGNGVKPLISASPVVQYGQKDEAVEKALLYIERLKRFDN